MKVKIIIAIVSIWAFFAFDYLGNNKVNTIASGIQLKGAIDNGINKTFYPTQEKLGRSHEDHEQYYDEKLKHLVEPSFEKLKDNKFNSSYHQDIDDQENILEHDIAGFENYYLSEEMEALSLVCSNCTDLLQHINLMMGNQFSGQQLLNIAGKPDKSGQLEYVKEIFAFRIALSTINQVSYEALKHYEQNVLGQLTPSDEIMRVVQSYEFKAYQSYLVDSGIIKDFCKENPKNLTCFENVEKLNAELAAQS